ncbi:hypothetical protein [uncultured Cellulomonas sp.]|uniref:hypothetical protein n=1 Tax=uncultured Cellulomonas sp. TaxID=189682 RepID=UPI0028ED5EE0|nr:hypothetical protein [uncultured Cellulomonas sp.]
MSATLSDEDLVRSLRTRADQALPTMSLDPGETVVAGRRRRRRHAVAGSVSAVAALALVAGVAVGAIPLPQRTPVATQAPRTLGTDPSVEVAQNIWAANAPITRTAPDGDWLDLNLSVRLDTLSPTGGRIYPVGVQALDGLPDGRAGVTVAARHGYDGGDGSSLGTAATLTWSTEGAYDGKALYPAAQRAAFVLPEPASSDWRSLVAVLVGDVPPGLENPRVFVTYPRGVGEVDDDSADTFEVPTFHAPGTEGRLLYAVRETVNVTNGVVLDGDPPPFATFVGTDGTTVAGVGCGSVSACAWTADQVLEHVRNE